MAAAEEMVFATQGAKAQEVVARVLAAPVSLAADQVREVSPGRSQAGEVWSPQLLPYQSWEGGSARAGQVDGDADGDLLAAGSLGMGVDDDARARLLAMAARQEGVGGSAAVDVPDEQDAPAVSVQREEAGYALVGFDLRALAQAAGVQSGLAVVLPSFVDGVPWCASRPARSRVAWCAAWASTCWWCPTRCSASAPAPSRPCPDVISIWGRVCAPAAPGLRPLRRHAAARAPHLFGERGERALSSAGWQPAFR